jgi:hypothetical protein
METITYLSDEFFKNEHLVNFHSMNELSGFMRQNIKIWSWGAHNFTNIENKLFRFKVQGRHFKGLVWIGVNGLDLFNVYFSKSNRSKNGCHELIEKWSDVYIEDLIERLDKKIEYVQEYGNS